MKRFSLAFTSNQASLGSKLTSPFHYKKNKAWTRLQFTAMDTPLQELLFQQMIKSDFTWPLWMLLLLVIADMVFLLQGTQIVLWLFLTLQVHNKHLMIFSILRWPVRLCPWNWSFRQHYQQKLKCASWMQMIQQFILILIEKRQKSHSESYNMKIDEVYLSQLIKIVQDGKTNLEEFV